jgi:hypothetical protein
MSSFITLQEGIDMTTRFRGNNETVLAVPFKGQNILPKCETFDKAHIDEIFAQHDCVGLRVYYSMDNSYKLHAMLVGVDSNDADILMKGDEKILDNAQRCPMVCPPASDLNS